MQTDDDTQALDAAAMAEALRAQGWLVVEKRRIPAGLPDRDAYRVQCFPWPTYTAERRLPEVARAKDRLIALQRRGLVPPIKMAVLHQLLSSVLHLPGEVWEAGVYQGGTALLLTEILHGTHRLDTDLRLFDTFAGMPETNAAFDYHRRGDFADNSVEMVRELVGEGPRIHYHVGEVPGTFRGLEDSEIKFAHIDLDIHDAIKASLEFIWPRMRAGIIVSDDYGFATCPGARRAIDDFFEDKPETPLTLPTGQAVIFKAGL